MKKYFFLFIISALTHINAANWGLWDADRSYIIFNVKGATVTKTIWSSSAGDFQGANLGTFTNGDTFQLTGYDCKTWKSSGGNVTSIVFYYTIYSGIRPSSPVFTSISGGWMEDLGGGNQKWGFSGLSQNLLSGLSANTTYTIEVWAHIGGTGDPVGPLYDNNNGNPTNFTATFSTDASLPVELNSFTSLILNNRIQLNWQTSTEVNNYGFQIERTSTSLNDIWGKIGFVNGNGNSNSPKNYTFTDSPIGGTKFQYRLKQIDFDGKFEYSPIIEVELELPASFSVQQNFPNPFNPTTTIKYELPQNSFVSIKVYDSIGRELKSLINQYQERGLQQVKFDASGLPSGIYYYTINAGNYSATRKMLLIK